jgi:hypothetical protein
MKNKPQRCKQKSKHHIASLPEQTNSTVSNINIHPPSSLKLTPTIYYYKRLNRIFKLVYSLYNVPNKLFHPPDIAL